MNLPLVRLSQQKVITNHFSNPQVAVGYMGAIQAQDFEMSKWAIGLRTSQSTNGTIMDALDNGSLVRTHVLRPTWHIVSGQDVRWMIALTGKNIKAISATYARGLGIDATLYNQANDLIIRALEGGKNLTRKEIMSEIEKGGIKMDSSRAVIFMMNAETDAIVCNGTMKGKEHTYALLDEKVPKGLILSREEALATLAQRYFSSHAPATIQDFQWWSGLSMTDARAGLQSIMNELGEVEIGGRKYFYSKNIEYLPSEKSVLLLPAFDEYCVSYKDRSEIFDLQWHKQAITNNGIFKPIVVINGKVEGIWKRTIQKKQVLIEPTFFNPQIKVDIDKLNYAAQQFGDFVGLPVEVKM